MGATNVGAAYLMWNHLNDGAFRVLVGMALRSYDEWTDGKPPRMSYLGEAGLVDLVASTNAKGEQRTYAARRASAYRYLAQLVDAGAVRVERRGHLNSRAVYALNLDLMSLTQSDPDASDPVRPNASDPVRPNASDPVRPLGTTKGRTEEEPEGQPRSSAPRTDAREGDADEAEDYDAATRTLERTLGTARAAQLVAQYIAHHPGTGYHAAVVAVATAERIPA